MSMYGQGLINLCMVGETSIIIMLVIRQVWSKSVSVANTVSTVLCTCCSYLVGVLDVDMSSYHLYKGLLST